LGQKNAKMGEHKTGRRHDVIGGDKKSKRDWGGDKRGSKKKRWLGEKKRVNKRKVASDGRRNARDTQCTNEGGNLGGKNRWPRWEKSGSLVVTTSFGGPKMGFPPRQGGNALGVGATARGIPVRGGTKGMLRTQSWEQIDSSDKGVAG